MLLHLTLLLLGLRAALAAPADDAKTEAKQQTVVILIDGFRHDYADREAPEDVPAFTRWTS